MGLVFFCLLLVGYFGIILVHFLCLVLIAMLSLLQIFFKKGNLSDCCIPFNLENCKQVQTSKL